MKMRTALTFGERNPGKKLALLKNERHLHRNRARNTQSRSHRTRRNARLRRSAVRAYKRARKFERWRPSPHQMHASDWCVQTGDAAVVPTVAWKMHQRRAARATGHQQGVVSRGCG